MKRIELYRIYMTSNETNEKEALDIYFKSLVKAHKFCTSEETKQYEKENNVVFTYCKCNIDIYNNAQKYWEEENTGSYGVEY